MVDGITHIARVPIAVSFAGRQRQKWDSRECTGPSTEAELSRPSTRRALTAGAIVLAVIAPVAESADRPADAGANPPSVAPSTPAETPDFDPTVTLGKRTERAYTREARPARASRARRVVPKRPAIRRVPAQRALVKANAQVKAQVRAHVKPRVAKAKPVRREALKLKPRRIKARTFSVIRPGMGAVIAFARSQVGKGYASGAEGPSYFDCSGFTKRAYARAGISLPHSSGAQAARAQSIPRSAARPGDLVVGPGHVGVYMGGGMMIDAGNRRTGVVYRRLYAGLHVERL
ncbi:NlpC/P60 family protein [Actinoplanes sp. NPDC051470]|uniref:C40 family peptidase n=1 Tax=unclassified Actinoplanes TaxID=2626549 RepID=UPI00342B9273